MDCVIKEIVNLNKCAVSPFSGQKCDGTLKVNWDNHYALIPEEKTCISRGQKGVFIAVRPDDMEKLGSGKAVLMLQTSGINIFVKVDG